MSDYNILLCAQVDFIKIHVRVSVLEVEFFSERILTLGILSLLQTHSESSRSRISQAKIEGHSRL